MGSGSKKSKEYVANYKYFWGEHTALATAPIDGVTRMKVDDREAWKGNAARGEVRVTATQLLGGDEREGGVGGHFDVIDGRGDEINEYLKEVLANGVYEGTQAPGDNPALVSAFKGVFSIVKRRGYMGNIPRARRWSYLLKSIYSGYGKEVSFQTQPQQAEERGSWFPEYALICPEYDVEDYNVHIAMDNSGSMASDEKDPFVRQAVKDLLDIIAADADAGRTISVRIQPFNTFPEAAYEQIPFTSASLAAAKAFVDSVPAATDNTHFDAGLDGMLYFYEAAEAALTGNDTYEPWVSAAGPDSQRVELNGITDSLRRVCLFITDGGANPPETADDAVAYLENVIGVEVTGILIDEVVSNADLRKISNAGLISYFERDPEALETFLRDSWLSQGDHNFAHIIRDIIVDTRCGGNGDPSIIGASFGTAAELFFNEKMGGSFFWDPNTTTRDEMRKIVESHCNARAYISRDTEKWEIKPIRPDYNAEDLAVFTKSEIVEWVDHKLPDADELPTGVVIQFKRRDNGNPQSIFRSNPAAILSRSTPTQRNINMPFEGLTCLETAEIVATREMEARTQPIRTGTIRLPWYPTNPDGSSMHEGDPFIIDDDRLDISMEVMRVEEIEDSDGKDNSVLLRFSGDVWQGSAQRQSVLEEDIPDTGQQDLTALPGNFYFLEEMNYYDLTFVLGTGDLNSLLVNDPEAGRWHGTTDYPNNSHTNARVVRRESGNNWINASFVNLMPVWTLQQAVTKSADDTIIVTNINGREAELVLYTMVSVGGERMRVDSVSIDRNAGTATWIVGRGVLDTVPDEHEVGTPIFAWEANAGGDGQDFTLGETVELRFLTKTWSQTLALGSAPSQFYTFAGRPNKPYPAGKLQVDGEFLPSTIKSGSVSVTWAHRNRLDQTSDRPEDHSEDSLSPEPGISYHLVERWIAPGSPSGEIVAWSRETALSPPDATSATVDLTEATLQANQPTDAIRFEVGVITRRGTSPIYENWQTPYVGFIVDTQGPENLMGQWVGLGSSPSPSPSPEPQGASLIFRAEVNSNYSFPNSEIELTWDNEIVDQFNAFASNRFTVPAGVNGRYGEFVAGARHGNQGSYIGIQRSTDGGSNWDWVAIQDQEDESANVAATGPIVFTTGHIYRVVGRCDSLGISIIADPSTFFTGRVY